MSYEPKAEPWGIHQWRPRGEEGPYSQSRMGLQAGAPPTTQSPKQLPEFNKWNLLGSWAEGGPVWTGQGTDPTVKNSGEGVGRA